MARKSQYYEIKDFAAGMDLRKSAVTAPAGTLRSLVNAHITPGGEIEKRSAFTYWGGSSVPGSFGLVALHGAIYTLSLDGPYIPAYSSPTNPVGNIPLPSTGLPAGGHFTDVLDWEVYGGRLYTTHLAADGANIHYYQDAGGPAAPMRRVTAGNPFSYAIRVHKSKMHGVYGNTLRFSCVGAPDQWADTTTPLNTGSGYVLLGQEDAEMESLQALEAYYDMLAVFSLKACQLWTADPDPKKYQLRQTLREAGTPAPKSVRQYGSGDILFLGLDGIRSLKAREQLVAASVSDIGSPIDALIRALYDAKGYAYMTEAEAMLQPQTGRYWMVFPDRIFVLSNFPNPKISAWSIYPLPWTVTDIAEVQNILFIRLSTGEVLYHGGYTPLPYDNSPVEVVTPFLGMDRPATFKQFKAIDVICTGTWEIYASINPTPVDPLAIEYSARYAWDLLGVVDGPTFLTGQFPMMGHSTHIALMFKTVPGFAGSATIASVMIHYDIAETT